MATHDARCLATSSVFLSFSGCLVCINLIHCTTFITCQEWLYIWNKDMTTMFPGCSTRRWLRHSYHSGIVQENQKGWLFIQCHAHLKASEKVSHCSFVKILSIRQTWMTWLLSFLKKKNLHFHFLAGLKHDRIHAYTHFNQFMFFSHIKIQNQCSYISSKWRYISITRP